MLQLAQDVNLDLHDRAIKAEAEVARLREALSKAELAHEGHVGALITCGICGQATRIGYHADDCPFAALSTPAWLEQHDAEVRERERKRIVSLVMGLRTKGYEDDGSISYSLAMNVHKVAAAIRELDE